MTRTLQKKLIRILWIGILSFACQRTPTEEVVLGKSEDQLLLSAAAITEEELLIPLKERLGAPQRYVFETVSTGGKLSVSADADVILPDRELPLAKTAPSVFSPEMLRNTAGVLFDENSRFISFDETKMNKAYYGKRIDELLHAIENWDTIGNRIYDSYDTVEEAEEALNEYRQLYASAPERLPETKPDFAAEGSFSVYAISDSGSLSRMNVWNQPELLTAISFSSDGGMTLGAANTDSIPVGSELSVSQQEAEALALCIAKKIAGESFAVIGSFGTKDVDKLVETEQTYAYCVCLSRIVNGIPITFTNSDQTYNTAYNKRLGYERILAAVNDQGIVCFQYRNPYAEPEILIETCQLLPFSAIRDQFEKWITIIGNEIDFVDKPSNPTQRYVITSVRLGLCPIRKANSDEILLVPAWDFLGYLERNNTRQGLRTYDTNELTSFLTVNAIDGSIISRTEGY